MYSERFPIWPLLHVDLEKDEIQLLIHKCLFGVYSLATDCNDCVNGISIEFLYAVDDLLNKVSGKDGGLVTLVQIYWLVARWQWVLQRETCIVFG
jgi:hypothetical protein